ncbi:uncharacterized protein LOC143180317 isoform X1 [Calliopsis andreniformis]|uniref:uncharacterized protein LOC143180317 isoform X1 n=1 Tax=Calliopsis andreniformis TaxID=337506 RepID=UPI003FCCE6EC
MPRKKNQVSRSKKIKEKEKKEDEKEDPYLEEIIDVDEDVAKDFEFLVNAPVSTDDFFVSEAEKSWTVDASKYSEYFTLDLKTLSAAVESIPFNELVDIDAKYFTDDQLTNIHNKAERGKENYNKIINSLKTEDVNDVESLEECQESIEDQTEDLEFLLSLKEPMNDPLMSVKSLSISCNTDTKISTASGASAKPMDLEKWLDSVLDD